MTIRFGSLVVTCEHGGCRVPPEYAHHFAKREEEVRGDDGWDDGALEMAREVADRHGAPLVWNEVTRLVVDLNRAIGSPTLLTALDGKLTGRETQELLDRHYFPYRLEAERRIMDMAERRPPVLHLSIHTFMPVMKGVERTAEMGLLYDPARESEAEFCEAWAPLLREALPDLRIRHNYPYLGTEDGLTRHMRALLPGSKYAGIEVETNRRLLRAPDGEWRRVVAGIAESVGRVPSFPTAS